MTILTPKLAQPKPRPIVPDLALQINKVRRLSTTEDDERYTEPKKPKKPRWSKQAKLAQSAHKAKLAQSAHKQPLWPEVRGKGKAEAWQKGTHTVLNSDQEALMDILVAHRLSDKEIHQFEQAFSTLNKQIQSEQANRFSRNRPTDLVGTGQPGTTGIGRHYLP